MLKRIIGLLVTFPLAVALIALAISNRHKAQLVLDPFHPETPRLALELPFYAFIFTALILGVVLGGVATWMSQGRFRKLARVRAAEAKRWHAEADRLTRERDAEVAARAGKSLALSANGRRDAA